MHVKIAGGAQIMNDANTFQIGKRNYAAIRQFLWKNGMFIDAEDVGGKTARNLLPAHRRRQNFVAQPDVMRVDVDCNPVAVRLTLS